MTKVFCLREKLEASTDVGHPPKGKGLEASRDVSCPPAGKGLEPTKNVDYLAQSDLDLYGKNWDRDDPDAPGLFLAI